MSRYLFECIDCRKHYVPEDVKYLCPKCSADQEPMRPLKGLLRCVYDYGKISKKIKRAQLARGSAGTVARFISIMPIESAGSMPPLMTSMTPLRPALKVANDFGVDDIWIKDDTLLPTASFKDRASSLVVACARERCIDTIATASTGNAATALAGMAASAGMKSVIFVPETAPKAKLTQIAVYGGKLIPIKGNYDQAFELSIAACERFGWYNRNTAYNPFTVEGKKTAALEICMQLEFAAPDWVIVPTGDGVILAGMEKGFSDLRALGLIDRVPKLAAIQAEGCCPIVRAFESGAGEIVPEMNPKTIADSISVGVPRAGRWVMQALASCGGAAIAVSDREILDAISYLGRTMGVFCEPAAATAIAGLKKLAANGVIQRNETVVVLATGNGLKDVPAAAHSVKFPESIKPDLAEVEKLIGR